MKKLISAAIFCFSVTSAFGIDIYVDANGTGDYPTIQAAITAASTGDVIILEPGTYTGTGNWDIDYNGKAITVRSIDPNDPNYVTTTIIDCNNTPHRGFYFANSEDSNSILEGITITNASLVDANGGGICCIGSSPFISKCRIISNSVIGSSPYVGPSYGGGLCFF